jgi:hypothetical protein
MQALKYAAVLTQWQEVSLVQAWKSYYVTIDQRKTRVTLLPL